MTEMYKKIGDQQECITKTRFCTTQHKSDYITTLERLDPRIMVDLDSLEESGSEITGIIFLQLGERAFPEERWNDFAAVILSWWLAAIKNHENEFSFMDGPFSFKVKGAELELWMNDRLETTYLIDSELITYHILSAVQRVITHLEDNGCKHVSLKRLKHDYQSFQTN